MSNSRSLVVILREPGSVAFRKCNQSSSPSIHGHPDWLGLPDVLYDAASRFIIGLVFPVCGDLDVARFACGKMDHRFARLRDCHSTAARELYFGDDDEHWLEITWFASEKMQYLPAQLAEVHFDFETNDTTDQAPVAVELFECDDVLDDLGLDLPPI